MRVTGPVPTPPELAGVAGAPPQASAGTARDSSAPLEFGAGRPHETERPDVETSSDRYASRFDGAIGEWLLAEQARLVDALLARTGDAPMRMLDVGGGHGQLAPRLLARTGVVTVQGSDAVCFARLAALRAAHPDRLFTCVAPLRALPFEDRAFDLVAAVRLLAHVGDWRIVLDEMTRVAGRFVLVEFARAGSPLLSALREPLFAWKHRVEGTTRPFYGYHEDAIVDAMAGRGFTALARGAQFALPMVLHRVLGRPRVSGALEHGLRRLGVGDRLRSPAMLLFERSPPGAAGP